MEFFYPVMLSNNIPWFYSLLISFIPLLFSLIKLNSIVVSTSMQTLNQKFSLKVVRTTSWSARNEWCWPALLDGDY